MQPMYFWFAEAEKPAKAKNRALQPQSDCPSICLWGCSGRVWCKRGAGLLSTLSCLALPLFLSQFLRGQEEDWRLGNNGLFCWSQCLVFSDRQVASMLALGSPPPFSSCKKVREEGSFIMLYTMSPELLGSVPVSNWAEKGKRWEKERAPNSFEDNQSM